MRRAGGAFVCGMAAGACFTVSAFTGYKAVNAALPKADLVAAYALPWEPIDMVEATPVASHMRSIGSAAAANGDLTVAVATGMNDGWEAAKGKEAVKEEAETESAKAETKSAEKAAVETEAENGKGEIKEAEKEEAAKEAESPARENEEAVKQAETDTQAEERPPNKEEAVRETPTGTYTDAEIAELATLVHGESGNQSITGKRWVAAVVLNRVDDPRFPNTIHDVIFQRGQFSCVADGGYERAKQNVTEDCFEAARAEFANRSTDALFFRTKRYHSGTTPIDKVGAHYFSK